MLRPTRVLLKQRTPMIKFLGRKHEPSNVIDHTPQPHPASPSHSLPDSFASYRQSAQQHGPLTGRSPLSSRPASASTSIADVPSGGLGERSGHSLGSVEPASGQFFDRSELPQRFQRTSWTSAEMEAIESGGASQWT